MAERKMNASMSHMKKLFWKSQETNRRYSICTPKMPAVKSPLHTPSQDIDHLRLRRVVAERLHAELQQRQHREQHQTGDHPPPSLPSVEHERGDECVMWLHGMHVQ